MTNKFLRHDGTQWNLDQGLVGPPGPPGQDGTIGANGVDGESALIYRPGGVQAGSVFTTWTALMAKRVTVDNPIAIIIDDSIVSPALVDVGTWDLTHNTRIVGYKGNQIDSVTLTQLDLPDGAHLTNPSYFSDLTITGHSQSIPSIDGDNMDFAAVNVVFKSGTGATVPLIHTNGGTMDFYGNCHLVSSSSAAYIISNQSSTPVTINFRDNTIVDGYCLHFDNATFNVVINVSDNASYTQGQPGISIAITINQANVVQAAPRGSFQNPSIVAHRPPVSQSFIDETLNGIINLSSNDGGAGGVGAFSSGSTILGGDHHTISANTGFDFIGGGQNNVIDPDSYHFTNFATHPITYSAIAGGHNNHISAAFSFVGGGQNNRVLVGGEGTNGSSIVGGVDNIITGSAPGIASIGNFIGGGSSNSITDSVNCVIVGGTQNVIVGSTTGFIAGTNNTIQRPGSGDIQSAFIVGGNNTVQEHYGTVLGGNQNLASGYLSQASGLKSVAHRAGQYAHAGTYFQDTSVNGEFQYSRCYANTISTNGATIAAKNLDGIDLNLDAGFAYMLRATCVANRINGAGRALFINTMLVHTTGATTTIDVNTATLAAPNGQAWTITYTTSGVFVVATFTGTVGHNVHVGIIYELVEVGGGA